ncbi:glycosyltransferase family 2 protein [Stygiolobus caldivivus]|uniref:Glycosyl transferase family 2 n=1 Tax=Stygiolobus caldivivus TaxID=2824673 RepID=A0A8D5ZFU9_9CREN|nr:glycosyltransferase family A protein [Stygiolobus caldivivus]BCU70483.1 glycosyl transferase family 2 [Stygiolobus caldivivus]
MVEIIIPVGPSDKSDWLNIVLSKVIRLASEGNYSVIVYDNSEREDLDKLISQFKVTHIKARRLEKVNMAKLRNEMLKLAKEEYVIMLDSDVIPSNNAFTRMVENLKGGAAFTWMHYAYDEKELEEEFDPLEENPNLGCSALNVDIIRELGFFDERYERDEDVWLYAKLKKMGYKVKPTKGRCLHLNKVHARETLASSIKEARRNLWRSKYDMMLVLDGLTQFQMLTGYTYYGSYYVTALLSLLISPYFSFLYIPIIMFGLRYYKSPKRYLLNLIPGLSLVFGLPYGFTYALINKGSKRR